MTTNISNSPGMVAAAHPLAAQAGVEALKAGGNAIDAAVVTAAVLNVVEPAMSGIGGGGFLLFHQADGQDFFLDAREVAPAATTASLFCDPLTGELYPEIIRYSGGLPVGVPGTVACWETALARFGTFSLAEALEPAIRIARSGFKVTPALAKMLDAQAHRLALFDYGRELFLPHGSPLMAGATLVQSDLSATLELVASQGSQAFYHGQLAEEIASTCQLTATLPATTGYNTTLPGNLTAQDLASYQAKWREPITGTYRGQRIIAGAPSASGFLVLQALKLLEHIELGKLGFQSAPSLRYLIETLKLVIADRVAYLADPDFVAIPVQRLLADSYIAERGQALASAKASTSPQAGNLANLELTSPDEYERTQSCTTHLSVVDGQGNAVSYTTTLAILFGSALMVPGRGFFLNDTLTDFSHDPRVAPALNLPAPYKRPRSSTSQLIGLAGEAATAPIRIVTGAAGGVTIPSTVLQVVTGVLDYNLTPAELLGYGRFYQLNETTTYAEARFLTALASTIAELVAQGYQFKEVAEFGSSQLIVRDPVNGELIGAGDPRRDGTALATPS